MRRNELAGVSRRKTTRTTTRGERQRPAPDLVNREFSASQPDRLWVADITYVPTWAGFLYLAVVLDAFSRRVVGWSMAGHLRTELVLDALDMALGQRRPRGGLPWDRWETATTTRCVRAFLPPWSASFWTGDLFGLMERLAGSFSSSSRGGILRTAVTRPWAMFHRWSTKGCSPCHPKPKALNCPQYGGKSKGAMKIQIP
jgi:hypothetical protein